MTRRDKAASFACMEHARQDDARAETIRRAAVLQPGGPRISPEEMPEVAKLWDGVSLSTRLRSYPATPPGHDALDARYVCDLMQQAADEIDRLTAMVQGQ